MKLYRALAERQCIDCTPEKFTGPEFKLENGKTALYDTESLSFLGYKIWELVQLENKSSRSLK